VVAFPALTPTRPLIVTDGQSLMNSPLTLLDRQAATWDKTSKQIAFRTGITTVNEALDATSITTLASTVAVRVHPHADPRAEHNIWVFLGGQSDLFTEEDSGQTVYDELVAYGAGLRGAGFDLLVPCTVPPSASYTAPENTERLALNSLLLSDPDGAFDAVADLVTGLLASQSSAAFMFDQLHLSVLGANLAGQIIATAVLGLL
jgi:hypothetical protein